MKAIKNCLLLLALSLTALSANAQEFIEVEQKLDYSTQGRHSLSLHYGIPSLQKLVANSVNTIVDFQFKETGPLHFKYQYRAGRVFEWGMMLNFHESSFNWTDSGSNRLDAQVGGDVTSLSALARMNLHFLKSANHNFYFGLGIGLSYWDIQPFGGITFDGLTADLPDFLNLKGIYPTADVVFGYRGFITRQLGISAEVGVTKSIFQGGLTYRFKL